MRAPSRLSGQQVDGPATPPVRPRSAKMFNEWCILTPRIFQGIRQEGESVLVEHALRESRLLVDAQSDTANSSIVPVQHLRLNWAGCVKGAAQDAANHRGLRR